MSGNEANGPDFAALAALTVHDVKNRLALVAARAEAIADREILHGVLESAATLTRLLAWYRAEQGALGVDIDARVPADLVDDLCHEMRRQSPLEIVGDSAAAPALAFYDEHLVRLVLRDALYNALRHARARVSLVARAVEGGVEFCVRDDGAGYPPAMLGDAPAPAAFGGEGSGLGLHLARRVAALHVNGGQTGRLDLNNDGGAVFSLWLP
jgi:signal transduction histidine kinase